MARLRSLHMIVRYILQHLAMLAVVLCALTGVVACVMAVLGHWPWIDILLSWNGEIVPEAGMYLQIGLTCLAIGLLAYLPANWRILRLENSHRSFHIGMTDIVRAYGAVHAADRGDVFRLSGEFEAMRERLAYLRDHPDLSRLEPEILEIAAQMSYLSRELAETYSDEKVARARDMLRARQHEIEAFNVRLDKAKAVCAELTAWHTQVELDESVAAAQLDRLRAVLRDVMPELGTETVVPMDAAAPEIMPERPALPRAAE